MRSPHSQARPLQLAGLSRSQRFTWRSPARPAILRAEKGPAAANPPADENGLRDFLIAVYDRLAARRTLPASHGSNARTPSWTRPTTKIESRGPVAAVARASAGLLRQRLPLPVSLPPNSTSLPRTVPARRGTARQDLVAEALAEAKSGGAACGSRSPWPSAAATAPLATPCACTGAAQLHHRRRRPARLPRHRSLAKIRQLLENGRREDFVRFPPRCAPPTGRSVTFSSSSTGWLTS